MPETYRVQTTGTADGQTFTNVVEGEGNGKEVVSPTVPAAKTGTLTTRTDNDTGVLTMTAGHGFATSDKLDVFWSGGSRRNMTATVAVNAVTVDGGSGDNLPVVSTAVTAMKPTSVDFTVTGDDVLALMVSNPADDGYAVFMDDQVSPAEISAATFRVGLNSGFAYGLDTDPDNSADNPLAGVNTTSVKLSHGATADKTMRVVAIKN
jgi:hypothetical protein